MSNKPDDKKTIVLIDASNYHYGLRKLGWDIDYKRFREWFDKNYNIVDLYFYGGLHSQKSFFDTHPEYQSHQDSVKYHLLSEYRSQKKGFFKRLRKYGYKVYEKLITSVYDNTSGEYKLKCNCDVELTMDALLRINDYERFILCSGDGDFVRLVRYLKYKHKHTIVIAISDRISWLLKKHSHQIVSVGELKGDIEYVPRKAENSDSSSEPPHSLP
jgi:uncharacterized LabA/DUF88 family protein